MTNENTSKQSFLVIAKAGLESVLPWDFEWLEVIAEEIKVFRSHFSWNKLREKTLKLVISLFLIWLLWEWVAPFREFVYQMEVFMAKLYLGLFLAFLPFSLLFSTIEWIGCFWGFINHPRKDKSQIKILFHSTWACGVLWIIFFVDRTYGDIINEFLNNL